MCFFAMQFLKMPYVLLVSVIIGATNVIPFFGPFIGAVPSAFLILLVSPMKCLYFLIFILVLQQFDGNILGPKILGDSTGLPSFWVLFSILLFGGLSWIRGNDYRGAVVCGYLQADRHLCEQRAEKEGFIRQDRGLPEPGLY